MRSDAFLKENFPLVVRSGAAPVPVEWFHGVGVARIAAQFVVKVFPLEDTLTKPASKLQAQHGLGGDWYAYAWVGLRVQVVEHGVGLIEDHSFAFDDYLTETVAYAVGYDGKPSAYPFPSGLCVVSVR